MRVVFAGRMKDTGALSPVLLAQASSLEAQGAEILHFTVKKGGFIGYLDAWIKLRRLRKNGDFDLVHAHYYATGVMAALSGVRPLIVSLMGSEIYGGRFTRGLVKFFSRHIWNCVIVKSASMADVIGRSPRVKVIPNGVDMQLFRPLDRAECRLRTGFDKSLKYILFISDPRRKEKNHKLAIEAVRLLSDDNIRLETLYGIDHQMMPVYMSAADLLILTSLHEGSPNVIKEAMACNLPIVATPVGDVPDLLRDTDGCFIASFNVSDFSKKIKAALDYGRKTNGREKIRHLSDEIIARELINLYQHAGK